MNTLTHADETFKQLIEFLYMNLATLTIDNCFRVRAYAVSDSVRAHDAIKTRWKKEEKRIDDVGMFIAVKLDLIQEMYDAGLRSHSFSNISKEARTLCTSLVNWKIDQYRASNTRQNTFEAKTVTLEPELLQAATNKWEDKMIAEIEAKNNENEIEMSIERFRIKAQALFIDTLTDDEVVVFHYWACSKRDAAAVEAAIKPLAISRRTLFNRLPKMVERYEAFVTSLLER